MPEDPEKYEEHDQKSPVCDVYDAPDGRMVTSQQCNRCKYLYKGNT
jgi:hypothetical protein